MERSDFSQPSKVDVLAAARAEIESGRFALPLAVFGSADVYETEQRKLFTRAWNFLAHETEIPNAGDYVLRHIGGDTFIVVRDKTGAINVFYSACRHRGMQVCRSESGNASRFICPYHGWVYGRDGALIGAPELATAYGSTFPRKDLGLLPIPKMAIRNGFVFGNQDDAAESFEDFLGDYAWYFDFQTLRTPGGLEVRGKPHRFVVNSNWKMGSENFFGDAYHTMTSHRSAVEAGILAVGGDINFRREGVHYNAGGAGGGGFSRGADEHGMLTGVAPEVGELIRNTLAPDFQEVMKRGLFPSSGTLFPNLSFISAVVTIDEDKEPIRFTSFRQWRPIAADKMEIISWCAVDKEAPEDWKVKAERAYTISFGSSGMLEQDDTENWSYVTVLAKGPAAEHFQLNYRMGLDDENAPLTPTLTDWPGPGNAYSVAYAEHNQREFWRTWLRFVSGQ